MSVNPTNPTGLCGIDFVEFASSNPEHMHDVFQAFGFSRTMMHQSKVLDRYVQHDINFILNRETGSFGADFAAAHGPSICALGLRFADPLSAWEVAVSRGAKPYIDDAKKSFPIPAVYGIGESLIYFVQEPTEGPSLYELCFEPLEEPDLVDDKGFLSIDHLTNNVVKGTMQQWREFYIDVFGFSDVRTFDIRGEQTGLHSYALRSPCGSFCIPINEGTEEASQIEEYLRDYNGPGIQHLAFLTNDLLRSLDQLEGSGIETLDISPDYYTEAFARVPQVTEDRDHIRRHQVLVDGDAEGYLLQIFTQNLFGPIFIELIQRKNHLSFGEGNFQALFTSIERDQARRGVL